MRPGQLSHYRLIEKIGGGGMGEVWRAVDTALDREAAIKVLPVAFATDPERLARFEREAKLLASLSHPNIASIFGLHSADDVRFLAMELVEGEDLSERLKRGALPLEEALTIARKIAEGLEAAHRSGVVHRDLKPANVMLTPEAEVKVLDFGLAKALAADPAAASADPSLSPTLTSAGTVVGTVLGTASYMSPEQAKGQAVDQRADVWGLGVILFEMLSGKQAFEGETISEVLASLLKSEPDWDALPTKVPPSIRRLLRRCLNKDPRDRLHDVADARIVLAEALAGVADEPLAGIGAPAPRRSRWPTAAALAVAGLALAYAAFVQTGSEPPPRPVVRFRVQGQMLDFSTGALPLTLSPDGMTLAYVDYDGPARKMFLRRIGGFEAQPVAGSEGASAPFFSNDGEWVGFFAGGELKKVALAGGQPIVLCPVPHAPGGATWLEDNTIVYGMAFTPTGLYRVSADGGRPEVLTVPDEATGGHNHVEPHALPGGRTLLFTVVSEPAYQVAVLSLESGEYELLSGVQGRARYLPGGRLVYGIDDTLLTAPFDPRRGEITGPAVAVLQGAGTFQGGTAFAVSTGGTLAYLPATASEVVWVDRSGTVTPTGVEDPVGGRPILSSDGTRLALPGGTRFRTNLLHIYDLARGGRIRLPGFAHIQWSPDDSEIYTLLRTTGPSDIYRIRSDGSGEPELIHASPNNSVATGISPDGAWLLFYEQDPETSRDIWAIRLDGESQAVPLLATQANERAAVFSPDGRWYAYSSNTSGRDEVYVRRFDPTGSSASEHLVSTRGGREPQWSRSGRELFYRVGRALMAVDVRLGEPFEAGEPRTLFEGNWGVEAGGMNQMYDVAPDGQRFVMVRSSPAANTIQVVFNWLDELE